MLLGILIFIGCAVAPFAMIALHELGHFLAGMAAGIPASQMKIRLWTFPQHVALRDGDEWLSPRSYQRYASRSWALLSSHGGMLAYVSGGLVVETVIFGIFVWICHIQSVPRFWQIPLTSVLVFLPISYLFVDLLETKRVQHPCGDFSALWGISRWFAVIITSLVVTTHLGLLLYVLQKA